MELSLRDEYLVERVNPLLVSPDPGEMGQMYIGAREKYSDGMTLACATPRAPYTYEQIKAEYVIRRHEPDFSDVAFFDEFFEVESPDERSFVAEPGQDLDSYTLEMRRMFILPKTENGHFDLKMPYDRSVAGAGRFGKHSFLWDGYQMAKGYAADGRWDLVLNVIDNTEFQINRFGYPLNGSADFYATRSQPDYFAHMVRMLADHMGPEALVRYLPTLEKSHNEYWMDGKRELSELPDDGEAHAHRSLVRMPDGSFLNRYWDDGEGPRLESYKEDVELADKVIAELTPEKMAELVSARLGEIDLTDVAPDEMLGLTDAIQKEIRAKVYKDLRSGAASGWDYSSRWFKDGSNLSTINTTDIIPIDHNSLLAYNEETLAMACEAAADKETGAKRDEYLERAAHYQQMADQRIAAINKYLWDPKDKIYRDYNHVEDHQTEIVSAAMAYPLYVGIANEEQTFGVADALEKDLLYDGGIIATTTENSKEQWDGGTRELAAKGAAAKLRKLFRKQKREVMRSKNVWAPPNWAAVRGLGRMAHKLAAMDADIDTERLLTLAETMKDNYMTGIETAYKTHGIIPEKHRGDNPEILANGGEYALVKVLAMPLETYRAMNRLNPRDPADHLPMARIVLKNLQSFQRSGSDIKGRKPVVFSNN